MLSRSGYVIRLLVVIFFLFCSTIDGESSNVGLSSLFGDWAVQVDGWALVALVTHELGVQLLVSLQSDSSLLVVFVLLGSEGKTVLGMVAKLLDNRKFTTDFDEFMETYGLSVTGRNFRSRGTFFWFVLTLTRLL